MPLPEVGVSCSVTGGAQAKADSLLVRVWRRSSRRSDDPAAAVRTAPADVRRVRSGKQDGSPLPDDGAQDHAANDQPADVGASALRRPLHVYAFRPLPNLATPLHASFAVVVLLACLTRLGSST